ncbi:MBL fold metallo-hydrolase [Hamadaea tsunoensis]|uniref:MBL fold metallo-hydrolase n=1 Tax=Hamadaea tsunoensis TaxID=53368 RepID=UPI00041BFBB4|nr:MBL fold metallo-hydrolase [Hamadaea tsunoensis]
MRLTVLGGCGAWPEPGQACSGFLVEQDGFRLLVDAGYATLPRLLTHIAADELDAVYITHGHPDHCADLNPLLRARALPDKPAPPLPVYALPGALDAVLALDRPGMLDPAIMLTPFEAGDTFEIGPFTARTALLPHFVPNAGVRLTANDRAIVYTGDAGPGPATVELARDADLLVAEATHAEEVPESARGMLSSARDAADQATAAGVRSLLLTHLWPGTDPYTARAAARAGYAGGIGVATPGLSFDLP